MQNEPEIRYYTKQEIALLYFSGLISGSSQRPSEKMDPEVYPTLQEASGGGLPEIGQGILSPSGGHHLRLPGRALESGKTEKVRRWQNMAISVRMHQEV